MDFPAPPPDEDAHRHLKWQAAVESGWKPTEVLAGMIEVADNLMLAEQGITQLEELPAELKRWRD
jgi:hypothetical protein